MEIAFVVILYVDVGVDFYVVVVVGDVNVGVDVGGDVDVGVTAYVVVDVVNVVGDVDIVLVILLAFLFL